MRSIVFRSFVALFVVASAVMVAAPAAAAPKVTYSPPVDAPISDPFRPPSSPYGPGNRGIEYATAPGTPVRAAADGTVVFAGPVAAKQWVTVRHADGVRTTYGPLADVGVAAGAVVHRGDVVGTTSGALTFTARLGEAYVDPTSLFDSGPPRVHLVPEPLDVPRVPKPFGDGWSIPGRDALLSAVEWQLRNLESVPDRIRSLTPAPVLVDAVSALVDWNRQRGNCSSPLLPPPPPSQRHVAVLVGGLGSSSDSAAVAKLDTARLGYRPSDVSRFSYRGGDVASNPYSAADTTGDIRVSGHRLADYLVAVARTSTEPIDVIAHSQGGLVVRVALADLAQRYPDVLRRLGVVVTLATPHQGADLANLVTAVDTIPQGHQTLEALGSVIGSPAAPDDVAVHQLAAGSDFLRELASQPWPPGVTVVSIAARGDVVVPVPRAHVDGAVNVVVPVDGLTAHDRLPASPEATREIALALAHAPPTCESALDAVVDATTGGLIQWVEHTAARASGG